MTRRPPRSTLFPTRRSSDLAKYQRRIARRKPRPGQAASRGYKQAKLQTAKLHKRVARQRQDAARKWARRDRKSTRLNSSHVRISYAVFCLKKKKNTH